MRRRDFITLLSGAATWPLSAAYASPTRVGFLPLGSPTSSLELMLVETFRRGLHDAGLVEGRDVIVDIVWVAYENEYPQTLVGLINRGAKILVTAGSTATTVAKRQTSTIPNHIHQRRQPDGYRTCREPLSSWQ